MGYRVVNGTIVNVNSVNDLNNSNTAKGKKQNSDFSSVLKNEIIKDDSFVISAHAADRIKDRGIQLNSEDMKAINEGINKAGIKGCKDSVILYKNTAFLTSIKNRTIVTAVDKDDCKQNVFTNIDSVVIL